MESEAVSNTMEEKSLQIPHVVVVPFPAQGHINAIMSLSISLASKGILITVLLLDEIYRKMFTNNHLKEANEPHIKLSKELKRRHGLLMNFMVVEGQLQKPIKKPDIKVYSEAFGSLQSEEMALLMTKTLQTLKPKAPPITCIISDSFIAATQSVCELLHVPRVLLWTYSATASIAQLKTELLISMGCIPVKGKDLEDPTKIIRDVPGILELYPKDIFSFYREEHSSELEAHNEVHLSRSQANADWVIVNTFEELEDPELVQALSTKGQPAHAIGPICLLESFLTCYNETDNCSPHNLIRGSLSLEHNEAIEWLDKQAHGSVLYVSLGRLASIPQDQLRHLAIGLKDSNQPFVWEVGQDLDYYTHNQLANNCLGLLVSGVPQVKVLSHACIGGFLTHNGWNSTIESICMGVPMIGWPKRSDQFLNCRLSQDVWRVGINLDAEADVNGIVYSHKIEKSVRRLMQESEGMGLRIRALELKEAAIKSVMANGSSYKNLEALILKLKELQRVQNLTYQI